MNPETDLSQAFQVLKRLTEAGWGWNIEYTSIYGEKKVEIYRDAQGDTLEEMAELDSHYVCEYYKTVEDIPIAILLAARRATEGKDEH